MSSNKESKFGKKKSGNKFNREKTFVNSEADILLADKNQEIYKEERTIERHHRRVKAGLEEAEKKVEKVIEPTLEPEIEPINKYDIKKYGSGEEAEKYLYHCHNCGRNIQKNSEFCNDKCKDFILVYNNPCKWNGDCKMCKFSKRVRKEDDDE
jgi:predicted nucleic acid-binding Zn ribbon protein